MESLIISRCKIRLLDNFNRNHDIMIVSMKRAFILLTILILFLINVTAVNAEEDQKKLVQPIKYDLAYPGTLPDNPLYKVKLVRDKLTAALISNPRKKVDFYLLQTDKGILATAMLVDKGEIDLAQETAFKAEHNYTLLTYELKKIKRKDVESSYLQKLKTAALKHQEVLAYIIKKTPKEKQKVFEQVLNFSKTNLQTVQKYEMKKPLEIEQ